MPVCLSVCLSVCSSIYVFAFPSVCLYAVSHVRSSHDSLPSSFCVSLSLSLSLSLSHSLTFVKVFFASAAPPVRFSNVYGIDIPTRTELIAHNRTEADIGTSQQDCLQSSTPSQQQPSLPSFVPFCSKILLLFFLISPCDSFIAEVIYRPHFIFFPSLQQSLLWY